MSLLLYNFTTPFLNRDIDIIVFLPTNPNAMSPRHRNDVKPVSQWDKECPKPYGMSR